MSNRTIFLRWLGTVLVMLLVTACMQDLFDARRGKMAISVKWPSPAPSGYSVLAIPADTAYITVSISGDGIPAETPIKAPPLKPGMTEESGTEFIDVPTGPKSVEAIAYDKDDKQLARGEDVVVVYANQVATARITLSGENIAIGVEGSSPSPSPTSSPTVAPSASPEYTINALAGTGIEGAVDSSDPRAARFYDPQALAYDAKRQAIYVADTRNHLIRRFDLRTGEVATVAGQTPSTEVRPSPRATSAPALLGSTIGTPGGMVVGPDGALYFSDWDHHVIRKISPDGAISTIAGNGVAGYNNAETAAAASFYYPGALAFDANGTLYVADHFNHAIRRISRLGAVTTLPITSDDAGGVAVPGSVKYPTALALSPAGDYIYVAEGEKPRVSRIHLSTGAMEAIAGTGVAVTNGEGGPALQASMALPLALAFTPEGELLIAEGWALRQGADAILGITSRVLKVTADGKLVRVAGQRNKASGNRGDGFAATLAELNNPSGLVVDGQGRVIIADSGNHRLRVLTRVAAPQAPVAQESASPAPPVVVAPSSSPSTAP